MSKEMNSQSSLGQYLPIIQLLHWVMAGMLVYLLFFSEFEHMQAEEATKQMVFHSGIGLLIPVLGLLRLTIRKLQQPELPPLAGPEWQHKAAELVHRAFYALFFLVPLAGIVLGAVTTYPVVAFGIVDIGALAPDNAQFMTLMRSVHGFLADLIKYMLIIHVGATIYHHVKHKTPLIKRMLPIR